MRSRIERKRENEYSLSGSQHHFDELNKRLDVLVSSAAVAELFGFTQQNLREAVDKDHIRECWKIQGFGRVFAIWDIEIVFGGGANDETFDSRMEKIDVMIDHKMKMSIDGALYRFAHTGPVVFGGVDDDE